MGDLRVATPAEMAEAWHVGVMGGGIQYVKEELRAHPPRIPDPIYHRDDYLGDGGWHSASGIVNPSAWQSLARHLAKKGLVAPAATVEAWDSTRRELTARRTVQDIVDVAIQSVRSEHVDDYVNAVISALQEVD